MVIVPGGGFAALTGCRPPGQAWRSGMPGLVTGAKGLHCMVAAWLKRRATPNLGGRS